MRSALFRRRYCSPAFSILVSKRSCGAAMQYSSQSPSSSPLFNGPLVQPADVLTALNIPSQGGGRIKLVDGSWHLPKPGAPIRDPLVEFNAQHCSGAVFFDIDAVADGSSDLPHMLPSAELFSEACRSLGITQDDTVVVYGCQGSLSAPRVWWTFRAFGHHKVHLLDGGLSAWMEAGGPIEKSCSDDDDENYGQVASVSFSDAAAAAVVVPVSSSSSSSSNCGSGGGAAASLDASLVATWQDVLSVAAPAAVDTATTDLSSSGEIATTDNAVVILDARPPGRFEGTAAEPRPGLRSGRIPGSKNLPATSLLREEDTTAFKSVDECVKLFKQVGVDKDTEVLTTCGPGVTAAVLSFALYNCFHAESGGGKISRVYDGSWSEWGARDDLPLEK